MSETYTEVKRTSWLSNILGSFVGALIGIVIFFAAFFVMWYGEGRTNMAQVAAQSVPASASQVSTATEGQLVAVTGKLTGDTLGDGQFLKPGSYLQLERRVEMYAWVEKSETERRDNVGGSTTETTTYSYNRQWTSSPESGENFKITNGHRNPQLPVGEATLQAENGRIGAYTVNLQGLEMPSSDKLSLTPDMIVGSSNWKLVNDYVFMGRGTLQNPQVGDVRITFHAVPSGLDVTTFGKQEGASLAPYYTKQGDELYRALEGDRAGAINQLSTEDTIVDWIIRIGTLLMLWLGLTMLLGPINAIAGFIPALKQASGCLIGFMTFIPALVIWAVALLIAIIAHNIWLLIGVVALLVGLTVLLGRRYAAKAPVPAFMS